MTWPLYGGLPASAHNVNTATSLGTVVTLGDDDSKGDWTELIAATPHDADQLLVMIGPQDAGSNRNLIDIGIGPEDAEVVIASNLICTPRAVGDPASYPLPLHVPAGSRLAARGQSVAQTGPGMSVSVHCFSGGFLGNRGLAYVDGLGIQLASTAGTDISIGATANQKTNWIQIEASTPRDYRALLVAWYARVTTITTGSWVLDIGRGGSGSEAVIVPDLVFASSNNNDTIQPAVVGPFWVDIAAGTRLVARAQESTGSAGNRQTALALYGIG